MEMDQWWSLWHRDWSPLDREIQHECADSNQGTSALLGWSRGQNGQLGDLREGLQMSEGISGGDGDISTGKK